MSRSTNPARGAAGLAIALGVGWISPGIGQEAISRAELGEHMASSSWSTAALAAAVASTVPPAPVERQRVFVRYQTQALFEAQIDINRTRVSMSGNVVDVALFMPEQPQGCTNFGADLLIEVGELPVGAYSVEVGVAKIEPYLQGVLPADTRAAASMTVSEGPQGGPARDNGGLWWSPEEPGWSLMLYQTADARLIGGWLTYASNGSPIWFFSPPGSWISPDVYEAPLLVTSGGPLAPPRLDRRQRSEKLEPSAAVWEAMEICRMDA